MARRWPTVNYHLLVESPTNDPIRGRRCSRLLAPTSYSRNITTPPSESTVLDFFTFDVRNPSSSRSCINNARDNARGLRHRLPSVVRL